MCTLTIVPTDVGYLAAMNRDELLSRPAAMPDLSIRFGETSFVAPQEATGGTWIACNERGDLLALLNWNLRSQRKNPATLTSRGSIIPRLFELVDTTFLENKIGTLGLESYAPFRLVGISLSERAIREVRWDGASLDKLDFPWSRRHWFSSSASDERATERRGTTCEHAAQLWPTGTSWLRRLHRSHNPSAGPYSICVHRLDAATVSYTEVHVDQKQATMNYLLGHPCQKEEFDSHATLPVSARRTLAMVS